MEKWKHAVRVGLKFCGGCNPTFPRLKFVMDLTASLEVSIKWTSFDAEDISRLMIVNGCEMACVDLKEFEDRRLMIFSVSGNEPGVKDSFLSFLRGGNPPGGNSND